jgi:phosphoribosylcarboxyaminoimidazole (NCAIR) mutase
MISFNNLPQTITAAVGAIVLSTMFLSASVGPVHAAPTQTAQISGQASAQVHA